MAYTDWTIKTKQIGACNCDYGCPCEFNASPTRTRCEGTMAMGDFLTVIAVPM